MYISFAEAYSQELRKHLFKHLNFVQTQQKNEILLDYSNWPNEDTNPYYILLEGEVKLMNYEGNCFKSIQASVSQEQ